jgi:FKBP-type peptidyl-prolyl cis-trans isomerase (trigger factor)
MTKQYSNIKVTKLPKSEAEITGEISADFLAQTREKVIKEITKNAELPGFRKGKVPEATVIQKVGEKAILEDAANNAVEELYGEIIKETGLDIVGTPNLTITKLALGNPLEFKIVATLYPEFSLPEYKALAKEVLQKPDELQVTEKDIDDVVMEIRKHHAHMQMHKDGSSDHTHGPIEEKDLPELTDELVKQFGDFADVSDFRLKIRDNVAQEKIGRAKEKKRIEIIEAIMDKVEVEIPNVMVQNELEKMMAQFKNDVAQTGMEFDEYLKVAKKTEEEIKKEWEEIASKKAKAQLVVGRIAEVEKISPEKERLEQEVKRILDVHKDADPFRVQMYVATMLLNEKVFTFLESQG